MISQQPHAMARLAARIERELRPKIESKISGRLERRTMRAMLVQRRAQARRTLAASNRPPELVRFLTRPPAKIRNQLKSSGWLYDPVASVWHLPDDPAQWPEIERLLDELEQYGIERLSLPLRSLLDVLDALGASGTLWDVLVIACRCLWRSTGRQRRAPAHLAATPARPGSG